MTYKTMLALLAAALLAATFTTPVVAQDADDATATDATAEAFSPLRDRFSRLRRSLQAQDGIAERDQPLLQSLRSEVDDFAASHPEYKPALAMGAQLSIWLKDHESVNDYFEKLVVLDPDNIQLAVDWEAYFTELDDGQMLDRVQQRLQELRPNDVGLAKRRAETYLDRNNFEGIVTLLAGADLDPEKDTKAIQMLATAYAALHQFADAVSTLKTIAPAALDADPRLRISVEGEITSWEENIVLWAQEQELREQEASADDLPRAEIVTSKGTIVVELFENEAPNTVANFVKLATDDFWPGTLFHRVEPGMLIQGGDPFSRPGEARLAGTGNPGYYIPDEHGTANARNHFTGSLAMAKRTMEDTAGCQFYFTIRPTPWLNGRHTVFGRVLEGMDVVRSIEVDDEIQKVTILRKRDHEYVPDTLPLEGEQLNTQDGAAGDGDSSDGGAGDETGNEGGSGGQ